MYTLEITPLSDSEEVNPVDSDAIVVRRSTETKTQRTSFEKIAGYVRSKFSDLIDAISTHALAIASLQADNTENRGDIQLLETANTAINQAVAGLEQDIASAQLGINNLGIADTTISQAIASLNTSQSNQDTVISELNRQTGLAANVDIQFGDIRPLLNSKGLPLKNGDLWKRNGQEFAEFDGVQWCGTRLYLGGVSTAVGSNNFFLPLVVPFKVIGSTPVANLKIISLDVYTGIAGSVLNTSDFWTIESMARSASGSDTVNTGAIFTFNAIANANRWQRLISDRVLSATLINSLFLRLTRTGSPSTGVFSHQICYTHVL